MIIETGSGSVAGLATSAEGRSDAVELGGGARANVDAEGSIAAG